MEFEKLCKLFMYKEPYYGIILSSMNREAYPPSIIPTIAVARSGSVYKLGYNKDYVEGLEIDTAMEVLKHEMLHVCFGHLYLEAEEHVPASDHMIFNYAIDLEANQYLDKNKLPKGCLDIAKFGFPPQLGAVKYYRILKENYKNQNQDDDNGEKESDDENSQEQNNENGSGGQGNSGNSNGNGENNTPSQLPDGMKQFDDHSKWPTNMSESEVEMMKMETETMVMQTAEEVVKQCGSIPSELNILLERLKRLPKPICNWKKFLRRYLGNSYSDTMRKSRKRESNRFPNAAGKRHQRRSKVLVAIDTSGSIDMEQYLEFMGQLKLLYKSTDFHVLECDTKISNEYDFNGTIPISVTGGGGTSYIPVMDYFEAHRKEYDSLIYFTDGVCTVPDNTPKNTLWVLSSYSERYNLNLKDFRKHGESYVVIKNN